MNESPETEQLQLINRREAIRRVSALLGGVAFVGGNTLLAAVEKAGSAAEPAPGKFSVQDIAYLDEIAETILPATKTPGAKAAKTGAFMALMVTDCYSPAEQQVFLDGMRKVDEAMRKSHDVSFMAATPAQRLAVLTTLDQEQKGVMDAREAADRRRKGLSPVVRGDATEAKAENVPGTPVSAAEAAEPATRALLSNDERTRAARFFHVEDRLHPGVTLCRSAGPLRSLSSLRAGRVRLGGPCLRFLFFQ